MYHIRVIHQGSLSLPCAVIFPTPVPSPWQQAIYSETCITRPSVEDHHVLKHHALYLSLHTGMNILSAY